MEDNEASCVRCKGPVNPERIARIPGYQPGDEVWCGPCSARVQEQYYPSGRYAGD